MKERTIGRQEVSEAAREILEFFEKNNVHSRKDLDRIAVEHSGREDEIVLEVLGMGNRVAYVSNEKGYVIEITVKENYFMINCRTDWEIRYYAAFGADPFGNRAQTRKVYHPREMESIGSIKRDLTELLDDN